MHGTVEKDQNMHTHEERTEDILKCRMSVDDVSLPTMRVTLDDHERFKQALEKYGTGVSGEEWDKMAKHCGWSVEDVKTYAYFYMHQLFRESHGVTHVPSNHAGPGTAASMPANYSGEKGSDEEGGSLHDGVVRIDATYPTEATEWSYEECILFENLLIRYPLNGKDKDMKLRLEQIASMLPNKTAEDCKLHYARKYVRNEPGQHLDNLRST